MTAEPLVGTPAACSARFQASAWDYLVIVGWLLTLTAVGLSLRPLRPPGAAVMSPVAADSVAFAFSVLPVGVYLTVTEGGVLQATWGKRRARLRVVTSDGGRPGWRHAAIRNAVKLLPWQLAHIAVARLILRVDDPITIGTPYAFSLLIPAASIAIAWRDPLRRALHDRVAGTRVVRS